MRLVCLLSLTKIYENVNIMYVLRRKMGKEEGLLMQMRTLVPPISSSLSAILTRSWSIFPNSEKLRLKYIENRIHFNT